MYFHKTRHPSNFRFADGFDGQQLRLGDRHAALTLRNLGEDVFHIELTDTQRWPLDARLIRMFDNDFAHGPTSHFNVAIGNDGSITLNDAHGTPVLQTVDRAGFGVCGAAWMLQLARHEGMRFYGQGEKVTGLEKTGKRTKFWNADVWADHAMPTIIDGQADPQYAAIPYLLVRNDDNWVGILVDHPGLVFMDTGSNWFFSGKDDLNAPASLWFGADQGVPAFYLIAGDSAASVTRRLQRLVGKTPLPPLWSLGHHQCRWGYAGPRDLNRLDAAFTANDFPNDGLWLDIDYMDNFKVFTTSAKHFTDRASELAALQANGRRIVPILDPGVKVEANYEVADSGLAAGIFCENPEGEPYVGFVWPGRTWFPDFSIAEGRSWWADYAKSFREWGFDGAWLDMNDPSTGAAELDDMRFQHGKWDHWTYHNQYATGMAAATRDGFLAAKPDERPFLLARSAATGSSRYTALWTGDNFSNWHHLRTSIHGSINLALSGLPFNGPDVPGFGGHADRDLAIAWYKAGCLFPFFRNHACAGTADQEPWAFGEEALGIIRHYVQLRYKLLPYFYQLWIAQARDGSAVLRPLFHDYHNDNHLVLDRIDDQFLIGSDIMQAPIVQAGTQQRHVALPGSGRWFDAANGEFIEAGRSITVSSNPASTPMYLREGSLIPMQVGCRTHQRNDLATIELHAILGEGFAGNAVLDYSADDGISYGFERGERSTYLIRAIRQGKTLHVDITPQQTGYRPLTISIVAYDGIDAISLTTPSGETPLAVNRSQWTMAGNPLAICISDAVTL